jgi:hypothetical protein
VIGAFYDERNRCYDCRPSGTADGKFTEQLLSNPKKGISAWNKSSPLNISLRFFSAQRAPALRNHKRGYSRLPGAEGQRTTARTGDLASTRALLEQLEHPLARPGHDRLVACNDNRPLN